MAKKSAAQKKEDGRATRQGRPPKKVPRGKADQQTNGTGNGTEEQQAEPKPLHDVVVKFQGVSIGTETARVGVKLARKDEGRARKSQLQMADSTFTGRRLNVRLVAGNANDSPDQGKLFDDDTPVLEGSADATRVGVGLDAISTGLTFKKENIDLRLLGKFANSDGRLIIDTVDAIPADEVGDAEDREDAAT